MALGRQFRAGGSPAQGDNHLSLACCSKISIMASSPANSALQKIDAIIKRVATTGDRVRVRRQGRQAAIVPVEDLKLIHAIEDYLDLRAVQESRAELRKLGKKPLKWEDVRRKFLKVKT